MFGSLGSPAAVTSTTAARAPAGRVVASPPRPPTHQPERRHVGVADLQRRRCWSESPGPSPSAPGRSSTRRTSCPPPPTAPRSRRATRIAPPRRPSCPAAPRRPARASRRIGLRPRRQVPDQLVLRRPVGRPHVRRPRPHRRPPHERRLDPRRDRRRSAAARTAARPARPPATARRTPRTPTGPPPARSTVPCVPSYPASAPPGNRAASAAERGDDRVAARRVDADGAVDQRLLRLEQRRASARARPRTASVGKPGEGGPEHEVVSAWSGVGLLAGVRDHRVQRQLLGLELVGHAPCRLAASAGAAPPGAAGGTPRTRSTLPWPTPPPRTSASSPSRAPPSPRAAPSGCCRRTRPTATDATAPAP